MKHSVSESPIILLAEDEDDDIALMRRAFKKLRRRTPLHVVKNGEEVLAYLKGEGSYSNRAEYPLPELLLLDLKMPRMDGFEVLAWIRQQPKLQRLIVVVLTSSDQIWDIDKAYKAGANSFLVKPVDTSQSVKLVQELQDYWLNLNRAPEITERPLKRNPLFP